MTLKLSKTVFGTKARIKVSGEEGTIQGFAMYSRDRGKKLFSLEYKAADGRFASNWFDEEQLEVITE